ncbi:acetoacetate--CoA ligase [Candidatus Solirubrobacter pratensis]|uniref:acetoacetate--CoA ligase n=1 Tax=Candidatus Solirubrobacter pratensis TaxID=1298857 RepID=UPI00047FC112
MLWTPPASLLERAEMGRFMRERGFESYGELWRWSTDDLDGFWAAIWDRYDVGERGDTVLASREMPGARWFPGTRVNYAEHAFRGKDNDALAIIAGGERRDDEEWTWGALREQTRRIAAGLRALGVGRGDRVAAYMPNIPETAAAFLATASLGAVWSSCSPDFGARSVIDRFAQIEPKVLLAVDGYRYNGRDFDRLDVVREVREAIPRLAATVLLPYGNEDASLEGALDWDDLPGGDDELTFERVAFDHPLWVLYSSGTTGLPKAIVHSQGGILLEHLKKLHLHLDAQAGDRLFWFTTTGWMMWNFIISGLLTDAAILLWDGSPGHPDMGVLWDFADRTGMTTFGTSASYIGACMKAGIEPGAERDLSALRSVGSTGSPLSPEGFRWIYEHLGKDTWLFSTSGGTDMCTAFVGGTPLLPVYEGELQARALGADIQAWDPEGKPLIGEVGELVVVQPMPSMPIYFWGDEDGSRYREAYFSVYPGVWRHGDWIEITERDTAIISGRSDATINRGGIRMGTAEIYRAVLAVEDVVDALVVDVPQDEGDAWMPLFVVMREGAELSDDIAARIRRRIREDCSPRHVPNDIIAVNEVPKTLSGKLLELPVKRILMGTPVEKAAARDSLANPHALDAFVDFARSRA